MDVLELEPEQRELATNTLIGELAEPNIELEE